MELEAAADGPRWAGAAAWSIDESGQTLTVTGVGSTSARGGKVTLASGTVTYVPPVDFNGEDTFIYTVTDDGLTNGVPIAQSSTGTVTVHVTPVNDPPVPAGDA